MRRRRIARLFVLVLPLMAIVLAGLVWAVYGLWNGLMPDIFGLRAITYWQALGLMALSWILFGGLRPRPAVGGWRHGMRERWGGMTPEEREAFVKGMRSFGQDIRDRWGKMTPEDREELLKTLRRGWRGTPPPSEPEPKA